MEQREKKWLFALITLGTMGLFGLVVLILKPGLFSNSLHVKDWLYGTFIGLLVLPAVWRQPLQNPRLRLALGIVVACVMLAGGAVFILA